MKHILLHTITILAFTPATFGMDGAGEADSTTIKIIARFSSKSPQVELMSIDPGKFINAPKKAVLQKDPSPVISQS